MTGIQFVTDAKGRKVAVQLDLIDLCITNRHSSIVARQLAYETIWES